MSKAFIGDPHGCHEEFEELWWKLRGMGIAPEDIYHAGDLPDRGPSSHLVIKACRELGIKGIMGNHDIVMVELYDSMIKQNGKMPTKNPDKIRTLQSLTKEDVEYMRALPYMHIFDDIKTILVHGGLYPKIEFWKQPKLGICRLQMIHPDKPGKSRWFNMDMKGVTEDQMRAEGWERWYNVWDHEYNVVFGHSGFIKPMVKTNSLGGKSIGVDTRCCFGGSLTAVIMPEMEFVSVPAKKIWFPSDAKHEPDEGGVE